jgi:hypothetical protein
MWVMKIDEEAKRHGTSRSGLLAQLLDAERVRGQARRYLISEAYFSLARTLAQVSRRVTMRLKTGRAAVESLSTLK